MDATTSNVGRIAALVRVIVEEVNSSIWHPNGLFPGGWCDDCSRILGTLLSEQGGHGFERVVGRRGEHLEKSHVWLRRGELIVDITADQFPEEVPHLSRLRLTSFGTTAGSSTVKSWKR